MPAARSAARSPSNSVSQRPGPPSSQEPLTTLGASSVRGLPSGSSTHSKTRCTALVVLRPPSPNTRPAITRASGAIEATTVGDLRPVAVGVLVERASCAGRRGRTMRRATLASCGKPGTRPVSSTATDDAAPGLALRPQLRRARRGDARRRRRPPRPCQRRALDVQHAIGLDRAHVGALSQPRDQRGTRAQRDRVVDPERLHVARLAAAHRSAQAAQERGLIVPRPLAQAGGHRLRRDRTRALPATRAACTITARLPRPWALAGGASARPAASARGVRRARSGALTPAAGTSRFAWRGRSRDRTR